MAKCKNCKNLYDQYINDEYQGIWCLKIEDCPDIEIERECKYYKDMSNADQIRNMTDEELVEFLVRFDACHMCSHNTDSFCSSKNCNEIGITEKWLQSPVDELH